MVNEREMQKLMIEAVNAQAKAYAPYSGVKVGAAIAASDGRIFHGANIENASVGLTICAERVAIINALMAGCVKWKALVITFDGAKPSPPCGACCQFLAEFNSGDLIIDWGPDKESSEVTRLADLLPRPFNLTPKKKNG